MLTLIIDYRDYLLAESKEKKGKPVDLSGWKYFTIKVSELTGRGNCNTSRMLRGRGNKKTQKYVIRHHSFRIGPDQLSLY